MNKKGNETGPNGKRRIVVSTQLMNAHFSVQSGRPADALVFLQTISQRKITPKQQADYYYILGEALYKLERYEDAVVNFKLALQHFEQLPRVTPLQVERVRNHLGLAFYHQNRYEEALFQHQKCLKAIEEELVNDRRFSMFIHYNLGNEYHFLGKNPAALEHYRKAVPLCEEGEDDTFKAGIFWGMGQLFINDGEISFAKLYLSRSSELYIRNEELGLAASVLSELGLAMGHRKEFGAADIAFSRAVELADTVEDMSALQLIYNNWAGGYCRQGKLLEAEELINKSIEICSQLDDALYLGQALEQQAQIKLAQGETETGLVCYDKAVTTLEKTDNYEYLKKIYYNYGLELEKAGKLAESFKVLQKASQAQNRLTVAVAIS